MPESRGISERALYRQSTASDVPSIRQLLALNGRSEATSLVEALLAATPAPLSLVAEIEAQIVGHVLLNRIGGPDKALALAPLSVHPAWREMQIGTELVRQVLKLARQQDWSAVFVYGQPDYYCRFGFTSQLADGAQTGLQSDRFLALELKQGALSGFAGQLELPVAYHQLVSARTQD
jgi:putative acetyltransferase